MPVELFPEGATWDAAEDLEPPLAPLLNGPLVTPQRLASTAPDREEEARRLQTIKNTGLLAIPMTIAANWRGRVVADLERFVTAAQFPSYLGSYEAANIVRAHVEEVLAPYYSEIARQRQEQEEKRAAESRLDALKAHGRNCAVVETSDWELEDWLEARRDVEEAMNTEVEADWSERDVEDLVDDVLDEFEEDDDPEDDGQDEYDGDEGAEDEDEDSEFTR